MARAGEIWDEESLRAWLGGRSRHDAVKLALRVVQRAAPTIWRSPNVDLTSRDFSGLPFLRVLLAAGVSIRVGVRSSIASAGPFAERAQGAAYEPSIADAAHHSAARGAVVAVADAFRGLHWAPEHAGSTSASTYAISSAIQSATLLGEDELEWQLLRWDAGCIEEGGDPADRPLHNLTVSVGDTPNTDAIRWNLEKDPVVWDFWLRWWEGVVSGRQLDWALQEKVALIPDEVWERGPGAVAGEIVRIEREFANEASDKLDLTRQISALPSGNADDVSEVMRAFVLHRVELPPTFDAVLGFITLEVERLQGRNYRDDDDRSEARRQIGILTMLHQSVEALRALVPEKCEMSVTDAEMAERLSRLFVRKFKEWPRANADELVDSTYRAALVGATLVMLPMIGVTTPYALAAGMVLFGGKKMADAVKAAKDALKS